MNPDLNLDLDVTEVRRRVNRLAFPVVLENLLVTGVLFVDSIMVGRLGPIPLAAIAIAGPISWTLFSLFRSLSRGGLTLVARHVGADDRNHAAQIATSSLLVAIVVGLVSGATLYPCARLIMGAFGVEGAVVSEGADYLEFLFLGLVITMPGQFLKVTFQAAGDTRMPMVSGILANFMNIVANHVFIFGGFGVPAYGVKGAAMGTILAQSTETALLILLDPAAN